MLYFAYLDEFGHDGAFLSRSDPRYKTSPVFGLGGFVLPSSSVRSFSTFFFKLKNNLLDFEIQRASANPYEWEKKGAALFTVKNIKKYPPLRRATFRIFNRIKMERGFTFHLGMEKKYPPSTHNSDKIYSAVLRRSINKLNDFCTPNNDEIFIIIDQSENNRRKKILQTSCRTMFGGDHCKNLIEPPVQAESHLYQTLQCADWLCGLYGRLAAYKALPQEYQEFEIFEKYFSTRLETVSKASQFVPAHSTPSPKTPPCRIISKPQAPLV